MPGPSTLWPMSGYTFILLILLLSLSLSLSLIFFPGANQGYQNRDFMSHYRKKLIEK
jgi:hypothetical protein